MVLGIFIQIMMMVLFVESLINKSIVFLISTREYPRKILLVLTSDTSQKGFAPAKSIGIQQFYFKCTWCVFFSIVFHLTGPNKIVLILLFIYLIVVCFKVSQNEMSISLFTRFVKKWVFCKFTPFFQTC